jgi:molecular chaperone DnaK (HSP70)
MKFRVIYVIILYCALLLFPLDALAGEIYIWVDENGDKHITDKPPEKSEKVIDKDAFKPVSPEEIQRYWDRQRKYEEETEAKVRYNQEREASEKRFEASRDQQKEKAKEQAIERKQAAIDRIEDLEARKERLRAIENRNYNEYRRLRLRDERRVIDRNIQKYREIKDK